MKYFKFKGESEVIPMLDNLFEAVKKNEAGRIIETDKHGNDLSIPIPKFVDIPEPVKEPEPTFNELDKLKTEKLKTEKLKTDAKNSRVTIKRKAKKTR
jgi:hypothetical protein